MMDLEQPTLPQLLPPFTRTRLHDLAECARRYWLKNIAQIPWPAAPLPPGVEQAVERGQQFHQLIHQHFLGLEQATIPAELRAWWNAWQQHPLALPSGRKVPEITISVPLAGARLLARFDLLVLTENGRALIVDWKTESRPRSRAELAADIQSQLYPFILAEGGHALAAAHTHIPVDRIQLVYWQANAPAEAQRFPYSAEQHGAVRHQFETLIQQAQALRPDSEPPLINELGICGRCLYRSYCGRGEATEPTEADWDEFAPGELALEPLR